MRLGIREQFGAGLKQGLSLPRVCRARPTTEVDRYDSEGTGKQSVAIDRNGEGRRRLHRNVLAIALANKLARIAWSVLAHGRIFAAGEVAEAATQPA